MEDAITVEIYDQPYRLRGTDPAYIQHLASVVDAKMRAVLAQGSTVETLRVAVLAALNLADELETLRERYSQLSASLSTSQNSMRTRSASLAGMLDEVFDEQPTPVRRAG